MDDVKTSSIKLEWKKRTGGGGRTERDFLDFVIDGQSLHDQIGADKVSCLGWFVPDQNGKAVQRLLRKEAADFPNDRTSLFVCGECGDLDCGAISITIERKGDRIFWREFGYENSYDDKVLFEDFGDLGPFAFDAREYYKAINSGLVTTRDK